MKKKCLSWRLKRVWCNEKSTLFLWRQELCHLPIILYPLQYIKQKSRNVVQEITIIKTCQQSKLHCKTINDWIRARKFKFFQIEIKALKISALIDGSKKCGKFNFDKCDAHQLITFKGSFLSFDKNTNNFWLMLTCKESSANITFVVIKV